MIDKILNKIILFMGLLLFIVILCFLCFLYIRVYNDILGSSEKIKINYILIFGLGILSQAILMTPKIELGDFMKLLKSIGLSLIFFLLLSSRGGYGISFRIFLGYIAFIFTFTINFAEKIIKKISEIDIYVLLIFFWYLEYKLYGTTNIIFLYFFGIIGTIASIFILKSVFSKTNLTYQELILYISYILLLIFIGITKISFGSLDFIFKENFSNKNFFDIFITGFLISYVVVYIAYIIQIIPIIPSEYRTNEEKNKIIKFKSILINNFTDTQLSLKYAGFILIFLSCFFIFDYFFLKLNNSILTTIIISTIILLKEIQNIDFNKIKIWQ